MGRIFLTSDLHFCHNKEFMYAPRGFTSVEEHDEGLIRNWNEIIEDDDDVYVLGDIMLADTDKGMEYLRRLKGKLHIIRGNHDSLTKIALYPESPNVVEILPATYLKYGKFTFFLCHYPTLTGNFNDNSLKYSIINLYGHTHQQDNFYTIDGKPFPLMYHVGLDSHDMKPVLIDDALEEIKKLFGSHIYKSDR